MGIGLLAPRQFFPCDHVELLLPDQPWTKLVVRRCRRLQDRRYEVGCEFADGILDARRYKQFVSQARL